MQGFAKANIALRNVKKYSKISLCFVKKFFTFYKIVLDFCRILFA